MIRGTTQGKVAIKVDSTWTAKKSRPGAGSALFVMGLGSSYVDLLARSRYNLHITQPRTTHRAATGGFYPYHHFGDLDGTFLAGNLCHY